MKCTFPDCPKDALEPPYPERPVCSYHLLAFEDRIKAATTEEERGDAIRQYLRSTLDPNGLYVDDDDIAAYGP